LGSKDDGLVITVDRIDSGARESPHVRVILRDGTSSRVSVAPYHQTTAEEMTNTAGYPGRGRLLARDRDLVRQQIIEPVLSKPALATSCLFLSSDHFISEEERRDAMTI